MARTSKAKVDPRDKDNGVEYRKLASAPTTADKDARTIEFVATTEDPVMMYDWARDEVIPEVLLMSGVKLPAGNRCPLLDSHNRFSTEDILGSATDIRVDGTQLLSKAMFSKTAEKAWTLYEEGHGTDFSVGYRVLKRAHVGKGETTRINGRDFSGPMNVVTSWSVHEISATPIGADKNAKARSEDESSCERNDSMNAILRKFLATRGLAKDATDEQATTWLAERGMPKDTADIPAWVDANDDKIPVPQTPAQRSEGTTAGTGFTGQSTAAQSPPETRAAGQTQTFDPKAQAKTLFDEYQVLQRKETEERRATAKFILDECKRQELDDPTTRTIAETSTDRSEATRMILDEMAKRAKIVGPAVGEGYVTFGKDGREEHRKLIATAITMRSLRNATDNEDRIAKLLPPEKRAKDWEEFEHATLFDLARQCLAVDGFTERDLRSLSREQIAGAALGFRRDIGPLAGRTSVGGQAYHVTASFPALVLDAMNKTLQAGYDEVEPTWRVVFRTGSSVPDFKLKHVVRLGAIPNLQIWPENARMAEASFADEKESYGVEAQALQVSFSWRLIVNDDMDALSGTPNSLGRAAARTVNAAAWGIITANPTMVDGQPLYSAATGNRAKANLTTGSATPTVLTLGAMRKQMRLMTGVNTPEGAAGPDVLNLSPKYIVSPPSLELVVDQLLASVADPAASQAGVANIWKGKLFPLVEPLLEAASATAWYLFADFRDAVTVEVSFLQGQERPVIRSVMNEHTWAMDYQVVQTFGAKAIDHRGTTKHAGA